MSRIVCYIPSYNDSDLVRTSLASSADWEVVISDNASAEPHRSALESLASDRVRVVRQERSLGRVGNWKFCVDHFIASGADWMKFLAAGDGHKPDALAIFRAAIVRLPDVRFMVGRIENVHPDRRLLWQATDREALVAPLDVMLDVVRRGSVLFGLLAPLIHVDAVRDGFDFCDGMLSFCADMWFLTLIARKTPTLYLSEVVAECIIANRKYLAARQGSLEHLLEESLVRLRAVDAFLELGGDRSLRNDLVLKLALWLKGHLEQPQHSLVGDGQ